MEPLTPEEFEKEMQLLASRKHNVQSAYGILCGLEVDVERRHKDMDRAMKRQLRRLGYGRAVDIFDRTGKWWA